MKNERFMSGVVSVSEIVAYLVQDQYLNLAEAAKYLSVSTRTLRDQDDLPRYRVGNRLRFKRSELDEWMLQHREGGKVELDELVNETLAKVI